MLVSMHLHSFQFLAILILNSIFKINQYEEKNKNENNSSNTYSGYVRGSEYYGGKK